MPQCPQPEKARLLLHSAVCLDAACKSRQSAGAGMFRLLASPEGESRAWFTEGDLSFSGSRAALLPGPLRCRLALAPGACLIDFSLEPCASPLFDASSLPLGDLAGGAPRLVEDRFGMIPVAAAALKAMRGEGPSPALAEMTLGGMLSCLFPKPEPPGAGNPHLSLALSYIRANYMRDIGAADIAACAGVHPNSLNRLFLKKTGLGLNVYVTQYRLKQARMLLVTTGWPIERIAKAAGFSSRGYFSRVFARYQGVAPRRFRQSYDMTCDYAAPLGKEERL